MTHQLEKLKYKKINENQFELVEDFEITLREFDNLKIHIPKEFITDFASTPKILNFWIKKEGNVRLAASVHDFLYQTKITTKLNADLIFYELLNHDNISFVKRNLMFLAVLFFGFLSWKK